MRVLTLIDAFRLGGAETLVAQLARVAADADLQMDVLSLSGPSEDNSRLAPVIEEVGIEPRYVGVRRLLDPVGFAKLVRAIKDSGADIVHAHLEMAISMAVPAAALAGVPCVGTFHHVHRPLSGRALARERVAIEISRCADAAIFVSKASLVSFAERYFPGKPAPANWTVVHNGIDLDYFSPSRPGHDRIADFGLGNVRLVTVLAALREVKGIIHALRAWPKVVSAHPDARLLLVGSGSEEDALRAATRDLNIADTVVFAGMRSDVPEVLRAAELTVLPSINGENLPTVLMEAGGCGRPVVATNVGGISDIVVHGETGLLVRPGDEAELAAAIIELLDDPDRARRFGEAGRKRMEQLFDARYWAANLHDLYEKAILARAS